MSSLDAATSGHAETPSASTPAVVRESRLRSVLRDAYGLLFGALPVLSIAAGNGGEYTLGDLSLLYGAALAAFALVYVVARIVWGRSPETAGLATALAALWTWSYLDVSRWASKTLDRPVSNKLLLPACVLLTVAVLWALGTRPTVRARIASMARVTAVIVTCWLIISITREQLEESESVSQSAFLRALAAPIQIRSVGMAAPVGGAGAAATRHVLPDIYVIILDTYGGARALREYLDIDNRPFEDSLRALGFVVPHRVLPNYTQTVLSLPSFLNMTLVTPLAHEVGVESKNIAPLFQLIEHNRALRLAKAAGYRVVGFAPAWWPGSARLADADVMFNAIPVWRGRRWLSATQFRQAVWNRSILRITGAAGGDLIPEVTLASVRGIKRLATNPASTFTFAHLLLPHVPYSLDGNCNLIDPSARTYGRLADRPGYAIQLRCTNKLALEMARELITRSATPPVIIFQGDHGTATTKPQHAKNGLPNSAQLRERFDTFGAYYLPGDSATTLQGSVSLVNVLRYVFSRYLNADLPPLADTAFYSTAEQPYKLVPVDTASFFNR